MAKVNLKVVKINKSNKTTNKNHAVGVKTTTKRDKAGNVKSVQSDYTRKAMKRHKLDTKAKLTKQALELEKVKSNNAAKVAIAGEAGATVTGTVGTGIGYSAVNQQVNGGITEQGGLGRDDANTNNSGSNKDESSWEEIIGSLGRVRG